MDFVFIPVLYGFVCLIRIITTLTRPVSEWMLNILYKIIVGRTRRLPIITNKIVLMSVTELAEKIRKRVLRAEEVCSAYIERCKSIHPMINAQVDQRFQEAIREAQSVDRLIASNIKSEHQLASETPLLGIPFSCKESIGVKGLSQTNGLVRATHRKAPRDSDVAALYRKAGAIPIVVTNVPELSMWWESDNNVYGWTRNPYDNCRTVGGSSGGEASLLTSSGAAMGIGSDIAGSIRIPSSFCGIYGHKPSRGLISNITPWQDNAEEHADRYLAIGPMCRYAEDLPLLVRILTGDFTSNLDLAIPVDFTRVNIFYVEQFPGWLLSTTNDIKAAVRKAAKHFEEHYNVTPRKLDIPELKYAFNIWECKLLESGGPSFKEMLESGGNFYIVWEFIKSLFRASEHTWPALYFAAVDRQTKNAFYYKCLDMYVELKRKLEEYLEGESILLVPTHPDPPPHYLMTIPKYPNIGYTCIFNNLGYPSTQIPAGLSHGLPIGIQAVSKQYKDYLTIAAAMELDNVFGGWPNPGPVDM